MKIYAIYKKLIKLSIIPGLIMLAIPLLKKRNCQSKFLLKKLKLPTKGRIRFVPRKSDIANCKILFSKGGYVDRFGNIWVKPNGYILDDFHWDVQLTPAKQEKFKWLLKKNRTEYKTHLNVTQLGTIHH